MSLISRLKHLQNDQIEAASRVAFYALQKFNIKKKDFLLILYRFII